MTNKYFERQQSPERMQARIDVFPSWLEVDLDSIGHNLKQIRKRTGVEIVPCLKTNAYGHGLVPVVAYLMTQGVKRCLVAKFWEVEQIREAGLDCGIVNMDPLFSKEQFERAVELKVTQTIYQIEAAKRLNDAASGRNKQVPIWVKIDTGLGRVGVRWSEAVELIDNINRMKSLRIEGLFSTLFEEESLDRTQVDRMKGIGAELDKRGISYGVRSMASSNAIFHKPFSYLDAVRPGLMLFGLYPEREDVGKGVDLKQAFCMKARLEHTKWIEAGESLTYSRRFVASRKTRVGTLHIGYSDGYPRGLTTKGFVKVNEEARPILGTVSVNHCLIDLTESKAEVGDAVEAIGKKGENSAQNLSELAGIMPYTLMVGMNQLLPRIYLRDCKPVALLEPKLCEK